MIQQTGYHYPHIMKLIQRGTPSLSSGTCQKCQSDNTLYWNGEFKTCVACGFEDYSNTKPESKYSTKGITYVAFYSGKFEQGIGKTATILISAPKSNKKNINFSVVCPWCDNRMREYRFTYRCKQNHRITLYNEKDGTIHWE